MNRIFSLAKLLALASVLLVVACATATAASPPRPFGVPTEITADTIRITASPCDIVEPGVSCAVTLSGTAGGNAITFGTVPNVAPGGSITTSATFTCTTPGQSVVVNVSVSSRALNRSGSLGPATIGTGSASYTCADAIPGPPHPFTVTIIVGGG